MSLDERKAAILRVVIEEYVGTAQPVGSKRVADLAGLDVSPATVRNEMVALEREGYLLQPHTSAGRIPTDLGYRSFVDGMSGTASLDASGRRTVSQFFAHAHGELENMLHDTSELLSRLTTYAGVVVAPSVETAVVRSVQLVLLTPGVVMVVAVLSNGTVLKHTLELGDDSVDEGHLEQAGRRLAELLEGEPPRRPESVGTTGSAPADTVVDAAIGALAGDDSESGGLFVGGAARVAEAFDAIESVRNVLTILEQQIVVVTLLRDVLDRGQAVAIGGEHGVEPLAECSIVVAPYEVEGEKAGTIGVLGPTRMDYSQALAAVAVVSQHLGRRLTEG